MIDCMTCLVAMARGVPSYDVHQDVPSGITHATTSTMSGHNFLTCTVQPDPRRPGRVLASRATRVPR